MLFYGTWELDGVLKNISEEESKELIKFAKKMGINKFDTALAYGNGKVEKMLGEILSEDDIVLTKIPAIIKPSLDEDDFYLCYPNGYVKDRFNQSFKNLNPKKIDIILLHNWSKKWTKREYLSELIELKKNKLVNEIGISLPNSFGERLPNEIAEIIDYIEAPYNDENNWIIDDLAYYNEKNVKVILRSLFKQGNILKNNGSNVKKIIENAIKKNTYITIGMTSKQQIEENQKIIINREKNKKYINDLCFNNEYIIRTANENDYVLNRYPFGVLNSDINSPLFNVSVSNSSLSIDIFTGCSFACKYCHVQGTYTTIKEKGKMKTNPSRINGCSIEQIIDELIAHPFFEKNKSIISICTGSTEPFGNVEVTQSTINIMKYFVKKGLHNPFWIVTKAGIPISIIDDIKYICANGNKIMLSICWAGNPKEIEPAQNNRFRNIEKLYKVNNLSISWYMRPIVKEWGGSKDNIKKMFEYVYDNYKDYIDMIVPGGMRWTSGIEYSLREINNINPPKLVKEDNKKTLDDDIFNYIKQLSKKYFPNIPVFFNSSCALSFMLGVGNINLVNYYHKDNCQFSNCPIEQRKQCEKCLNKKIIPLIEEYLLGMGIDIKIIDINLSKKKIETIPSFDSFNYQIKQTIIKTIANFKNGDDLNGMVE